MIYYLTEIENRVSSICRLCNWFWRFNLFIVPIEIHHLNILRMPPVTSIIVYLCVILNFLNRRLTNKHSYYLLFILSSFTIYTFIM